MSDDNAKQITDEELRIMFGYCGGDPRVPRTVSETVFSEGEAEWDLEDFLTDIEEAVAKIPDEYRKTASVDLNDCSRLTILFERRETEVEVAVRVARALQYARDKLDEERQVYRRLHRKYGASP